MPYPGYQLCNVLGSAWAGLVGSSSPLWEACAVGVCILWEACWSVYPVGGLGVSSPVRRRGRIGVSRQWRNLNMIISCE